MSYNVIEMSYCNQLITQKYIINDIGTSYHFLGTISNLFPEQKFLCMHVVSMTLFLYQCIEDIFLLKIIIFNTVCPPQIQLETKGGPIQTLAVHDVTKFYNDDIVAGDSLGTVTVFCNQQILSRHGLAKSSIRCLQIHKDPCKLGYHSLIVLYDLVVKLSLCCHLFIILGISIIIAIIITTSSLSSLSLI